MENQLVSPRQRQTAILEKEITSIFYEFNKIYGNGKISAELKSRGITLSIPSVTFYMKKLGLISKVSRKKKGTSDSRYNPCIFPNVLNGKFTVDEPCMVWVSGITSLQVREGILFLTIIMDLYDRQIIGYILSSGLTIKQTAMPAWEMAVNNRKIKKKLLFHSDRGIQWANKMFTRKLNSYKCITRSMSRQGNHLDNAVPKHFFNSLKSVLTDSGTDLTSKQMEEIVVAYIEHRNNNTSCSGNNVLLEL